MDFTIVLPILKDDVENGIEIWVHHILKSISIQKISPPFRCLDVHILSH